ncbi:Argonaute-1 protein [Ceratobasidium theobromae]|uniref:Argonaute-1 protein n=1 Tax=Ceratobasidium theobromae TaxID=1582974 RepID=A0A5N5QUA3_9AGAM|nr:Argonaute-1 protein [Ceratobasidium theobromae]
MPPKRGKKTPAGPGPGASAAGPGAAPPAPTHVDTIGVKRPGFGKAGRPTSVLVNHFVCKIPTGMIYHYDTIGDDKKLPARANVETMKVLQEQLQPNIFTPKGAYDSRKNLFTIKRLDLGDTDSRVVGITRRFEMPMGNPRPDGTVRSRRIKVTLVQQINPELLSEFQLGRHAQDNEVQTALTALNVALRHEPISSFFLPTGTRGVGLGLELWPGIFQSIRPAINSMHINVDTSTGLWDLPVVLHLLTKRDVYRSNPGPVITHALEFLGRRQPADLSLQGRLDARDLRKLESRLKGLRICLTYVDSKPAKSIQGLTNTGASSTMFESNGQNISVAQYFQQTLRKPVRFPDLPCLKVSRTAVVPMEFCDILPGQLMRKRVPEEITDEMVQFSRRAPADRLAAIRSSMPSLEHKTGLPRDFGITVEDEPVECPARILDSPQVMYNRPVRPRNGVWNLRDERLKTPATVKGWILVIFDRQQFFDGQAVKRTIEGLKQGCQEKGITGLDMNPLQEYAPPQGDISKILGSLGMKFKSERGHMPNLIVAVMPKSSGDIYAAVKRPEWQPSVSRGKNATGVTLNISATINVKLGGVNAILPPSEDLRFITDPANPTMIMGADVAHPAPGTEGRPSFAALVGSVDSAGSKYIAAHRAQGSRVEGIADLEDMAKHLIKMFQGYQKMVEKKATVGPKRILFYRDGVSEGQFKYVIENEVPALKRACEACGLKPLPKITFVIVGKRHHTRMFPKNSKDTSQADKSGNCFAGTVIDQTIGHFKAKHLTLDARSSVVHDDNNFTPDSLQKLSFALCHVYARATRSVSIPAPVYFKFADADIVCGRAKHHLPPGSDYDLSDTMTIASGTDADAMLERIKAAYRPTHPNLEKNM